MYMVVTKLYGYKHFELNFHACYVDGGASVGVGVASQFPRQQGEIEHQYDPLIKKVKKKDSQRKRDEGTNEGEMDHNYHELEGLRDNYDYQEKKERDIVYHVLDGPTPIETDLKTSQNRPHKVYSGELQKIYFSDTTRMMHSS